MEIEKRYADKILQDAEKRIKDCLKVTNKSKTTVSYFTKPWQGEALGYKTSLECIKRTREQFGINSLNTSANKSQVITKIKELIKYIDSTIESRNATEPNALAVRNILAEMIE